MSVFVQYLYSLHGHCRYKAEKQFPLREPDLKIVLTGKPIAYTRPDGVHEIPLASLKP